MTDQNTTDPDARLAFEPLVRSLLPCPFCGLAPEVKTRQGSSGESPYLCFVVCYCGTHNAHAHQQGRGATELHARQDAIDAWNRRV